MNLDLLTENEIVKQLALHKCQPTYNPYPLELLEGIERPAAILIPITRIQNSWYLLYIRRTENEHDRHGGQVAFPGGKVDPKDLDLESAALREAEEEVGLNPKNIRLLGRLGEFISITNYRVTPVVGIFDWPYNFHLDPKEVSRAFTIPLSWLSNSENLEVNYRNLPPNEPFPVYYYKPYDGEVLWGFSARVTLRLLEVLSL